MRSTKYGLGLAITAACMAFVATSAAAATNVVSSVPALGNIDAAATGNATSWSWATQGAPASSTASGTLVDGPLATPLGIGSFQLKTGSPGDFAPGKSYLVSPANLSDSTNNRIRLIDQLEYSTYSAAFPSATPVTPILSLEIDPDGAGPGVDDNGTIRNYITLSMEPLYTVGDSNVVAGKWQNWDALGTNARWYTTRDLRALAPSIGPNSYVSWETIRNELPNATLIARKILISAGASSGPASLWSDYTGAVDDVKVGINRDRTSFDFEKTIPDNTGPKGDTGAQGGAGGQGPAGATGPQGQLGGQGSQGTQGLTPSTVKTGKVSVTSRSLKASKRRKVSVRISCPRANGLCDGRLNLLKGRRVIARKAFVVRGGRSGTLSRKAYRALKKSQRMRVDSFSRDLAGAASETAKSLTLTK